MELQIKKKEIQYSIKTRKFIKKSFVDKVPNELILEIIKYVGFNEICFNPYNILYNYYKEYYLNVLMNNNFNRSSNLELETSLT